jgi:hypothetical protein
MNEAEIIKKIAEQKKQKAIDLRIDQDVEFLLFGQGKAKYWASWLPNQSSEWEKKLFELLKFKSIRTFTQGEGEKKFDCKEFIFSDYKFTFKISDFRSAYWDTDDDSSYGDLHVFYGEKEVASFGLIENHDSYIGALDPKVVSVDSFIEGDWIQHFNEFVTNAKLFYFWDEDRKKKERTSIETTKLKKKFGITDDEIAKVSSNIAKVREPSVNEVKKGTSFEIDYDKFNELASADKTSGGIVAWIKANPRTSISIVAIAILLFSLITS